LLSFPNCKINLGLNVVAKRDDGFHNIETIFYPVKLTDALEIIPRKDLLNDIYEYTDGISIQITGNAIEGDIKDNLCYKAFQLLRKDFLLPDIALHLHKVIPSGAGLGGGSADGAFTLKLLNDIFDLKRSEEELENYALKLGSDCAFFIRNESCFATGRGELMEELFLPLMRIHITIVKPDIHISTADAYKMVTPMQPENSLKKLLRIPFEEWNHYVTNDFEDGIFALHPELKTIKQKLYDAGAFFALMSGSGSSLYALSYKKLEIENAFAKCFVWQGVL
jgi:4-diphosphocytidyl-2-C-methyl-D-erythritol kinase